MMYSNRFKVNDTIIFMHRVKSISIEKWIPIVESVDDEKYTMKVYFFNDDKPITEIINKHQKEKLERFLNIDEKHENLNNFNIF